MSSRKGAGENVCDRSGSKKSRDVGDVARVGKHSLSQSLHNLFHRKKSYSLKHGSSDKKKKLYESINMNHGTDSKSRPVSFTRESGKARVWSVRNSTSKSPVENCVFRATVKESAEDTVEKTKSVVIPIQRSVKNNACSHSFDVLGSIKDYLKVNDGLDTNNGNLTNLPEEGTATSSDDTNGKGAVLNVLNSQDFLGSDSNRSRLSSFSSSTCYSDTSFGCTMSFCRCHGNDKKSLYSTDSQEELNTSYWDLQLPSESPTYQDVQYSRFAERRYSLSTSAECRTLYAKPDARSLYLARRRLSDQVAMHSNRPWQDKLLSQMNSQTSTPSTKSRSMSFEDFVSRRDARACKSCRNIPSYDSRRSHSEVGRSSSLQSDGKKPLPSKAVKNIENKDSNGKKHVHRSRSADSSKRRRLYSYRQRHSSLRCCDTDLDFSDIESSEESESTHEPKETSSEGQPPSSCNDFSSCSVSSGNEPNTPDIVKRSVVVSHVRDDEAFTISVDESVSKDISLDQTEIYIDESTGIRVLNIIESLVYEFIDSEILSIVTNLSEDMVKYASVVTDKKVCINDELYNIPDDFGQVASCEASNEIAEITSSEANIPQNTNNISVLNEQHDKSDLEVRQELAVTDVERADKHETSDSGSDVEGDNKCGKKELTIEKHVVESNCESDKCGEPIETGSKLSNNEPIMTGGEFSYNEPQETGAELANNEPIETGGEFSNGEHTNTWGNVSNDIFGCLFHLPTNNQQTSTIVTVLECKLSDDTNSALLCENSEKECRHDIGNLKSISLIDQNVDVDDDKGTDVDQGMYDLEMPDEGDVDKYTTDVSAGCEEVNQNETENNAKIEDLKLLEEKDTSDHLDVAIEKQTLSAKIMDLEETNNTECDYSRNESVLEKANRTDEVSVSAEKSEDGEPIQINESGSNANCLAADIMGTKDDKASLKNVDLEVTDCVTSNDDSTAKFLNLEDVGKEINNENEEFEIENVLTYFDAVLQNDNTSVESDHDGQELEKGEEVLKNEAGANCELGIDKMGCDQYVLSNKHTENVCDQSVNNEVIEQENENTDTVFNKTCEDTDNEFQKDHEVPRVNSISQNTGGNSNKTHLTKAKSLHIMDAISCEQIYEAENKVPDEFVEVENAENLKLDRSLIDELMLKSGLSDAPNLDKAKVDLVLEAINKEANKDEHKDKDMMVMFLVGGELKVLRRSGTHVVGNHGDFRQSDIPSMTRKDLSHQNGNGEFFHSRSTVNVNRGRPKSAIIVTRSQSFNGMANQHVSMGMRRDGPQAVVLGESFRHHRSPPIQSPRASPGTRGAVGFSFKKSPKVPKVPRPNRALLMFQSVKRGIREFIEATKEDIDQLQHRETDGTSTAQGKIHETDKQMKSAERYLKRLEFHLAKLDELHEYYLLQQQLREGVRTMHRAYVTSPGNQRHTLSNVKYGYKECTQNMCNIEAQLEAMMGTFNCKLKGMAGFARLCPGDVFEVTVRHGTQKWKTKGRIEKTGNQKWDIPEFNFKAVVGDIFNIKGLEVRAFKSVLLGQKSCETKDLFSANPQLMTVSINVNGSLKLSIVITWNPLDGVDENFTFVEAPGRAQGTPRRRPVSVIALNGEYDDMSDRRQSTPVMIQQTKDDNFILRTNPPVSHTNNNNVTSYHGLDSPHVSARLSDHLPDAYRQQTGPLYSQTSHYVQTGFHSSPALPVSGESDSKMQLTHPPTQNNVFKNSMPALMGNLHFPSVSSHVNSGSKEDEHSVLNIEDVLHNLSSLLEDYHGQYTELQKLEELVKLAQKLIRKQFRSSSRSSSISVSIESALEAFDFLDTEDTMGEPQSPTDNPKPCFDDMLCSPESTAKTGDSGIESLAQRLSEDTQLGSSLGSSPVPPTTGNEEVDQCLMYHLTYCERLLENLGAFGPLKCREIYALDKIQKQCTIVENLLKMAKSGSQVNLHSVMAGICEDKSLREFWTKCTDQTSLYLHPERLITTLEQKYNTVIAEKYMIDPVKVCQHVVTRVLDVPDYEAEKDQSWFVLTLHQFMLYFTEEGGLGHVENVATEMKLVEKLTSGNPDIVIKAILTLRESLPSSPCLKVIGMLLVTMDTEVEQCTISYLNLIQRKKESRDKAMVTFVEGLEDRTPEIRCGACVALSILEATESIDQLVYLWQSDSSNAVQKRAKDALLTLGDEGRKAFEEAQLSKHGFQGIQVHK